MFNVLLDREYNDRVQVEWDNFINNRPITPGVLRPEIEAYWNELKGYDVDPAFGLTTDDFQNAPVISDVEKSKIREENRLLISVSKPLLENLYESLPGPNVYVALFSKDPIALFGYDRQFPKTHDIMGITGTSTYGMITDTILCMRTNEPSWCFGQENYAYSSKNDICSSAPIHDEEGQLIGIITISVDMEYAHWHTLGMTISTAKAIEEAVQLAKKNEENIQIANQLLGAIESAPQGMIILDSDGLITNMNSCARRILYLEDKCIGMHIGEVLLDKGRTFQNPIHSGFNDQEMLIKTSVGSKRYFISFKKFIPVSSSGSNWGLVIIKEFEEAKKLTNVMSNSFARYTFDDIIGNSPALKRTIQLGHIASKSISTVLITGPSGTGKELFAQAIHAASDRANGPFISINCGALPSSLVESELFGYERGAFTGAKKEGQIGKFELANHGTIFLDEIGEMPLQVQASLLRVIQTKEVTRIGGTTSNVLDIRIIAATNKDLLGAIKDKEFREDLYYRLNVLRLNIPSLSDRREDIPLLADYFINFYSAQLGFTNVTLSKEAHQLLMRYPYPGNIRELENIIERTVNICESNCEIDGETISFFLDAEMQHNQTTVPEIPSPPLEPEAHAMIKDVEKNLIIETLTSTNGSVTKTAELTGIGRRTLYRKFEEYGINHKEYKHKK